MPREGIEYLQELNVNALTTEILRYVSSLNRYLEIKEPWKLAKNDTAAAGTVLYAALAGLRFSAALLYPLLPEKMREFFAMLNTGEAPGSVLEWDTLPAGVQLQEMIALFPRFDLSLLESSAQ